MMGKVGEEVGKIMMGRFLVACGALGGLPLQPVRGLSAIARSATAEDWRSVRRGDTWPERGIHSAAAELSMDFASKWPVIGLAATGFSNDFPCAAVPPHAGPRSRRFGEGAPQLSAGGRGSGRAGRAWAWSRHRGSAGCRSGGDC